MATAIQTATLITNEVLRIAHNNSAFLGNMGTDYEKNWKGKYAPGSTVYARRPVQFTIRSGAAANIQDLTDSTVPIVVQPELGIDFAISDFDLTTGRQVEVGSKFDYWEGRGSATLAAYHIVRKNLAIADPNQPGVTLPVGQQSSRGIELATALRLSPRWWVKADVSLVDAQYDTFTENVSGVAVSRAGKRPSNIPARVANLRVSHDLTGALQVGMDARYVSRRYADAANTISDTDLTVPVTL